MTPLSEKLAACRETLQLNEVQLTACARSAYEAFSSVNPSLGPSWVQLPRDCQEVVIGDTYDYLTGKSPEELHDEKVASGSYGPLTFFTYLTNKDPKLTPWSNLEVRDRANLCIISEMSRAMYQVIRSLNSPEFLLGDHRG